MTIGFLPLLLCSGIALSSGEDVKTLQPFVVANPDLTLQRLSALSWPELDALYRGSSPGRPPTGTLTGRAIYSPDQAFAKLRSKATQAIWLGKDFDSDSTMLINRWRFGRAVKAEVYPATSFLDGQPTLVMDYRRTSPVIWHNVRDELREVAQGYISASCSNAIRMAPGLACSLRFADVNRKACNKLRVDMNERSGIRESNPSHSLGKAGHSRYTNPAIIQTHAFPHQLPSEEQAFAAWRRSKP